MDLPNVWFDCLTFQVICSLCGTEQDVSFDAFKPQSSLIDIFFGQNKIKNG